MTQQDYLKLLFSVADLLKTEILKPSVIGDSQVVTRYITSEGTDDEQWLAHLRDDTQKTDVFIMTFSSITGVEERLRSQFQTNTTGKPINLALDFFFDYEHGVDYTEDSGGAMLTTNSERQFLEKVFAVDFALENKKGCLHSNIRIDAWLFRLKIKRFANASTHWLNGTLSLEIQDILL